MGAGTTASQHERRDGRFIHRRRRYRSAVDARRGRAPDRSRARPTRTPTAPPSSGAQLKNNRITTEYRISRPDGAPILLLAVRYRSGAPPSAASSRPPTPSTDPGPDIERPARPRHPSIPIGVVHPSDELPVAHRNGPAHRRRSLHRRPTRPRPARSKGGKRDVSPRSGPTERPSSSSRRPSRPPPAASPASVRAASARTPASSRTAGRPSSRRLRGPAARRPTRRRRRARLVASRRRSLSLESVPAEADAG